MTVRILPGPDSIWGLAFPAIVWSLHFLWCYVVTAIFCATRVASDEVLGITLMQLNILIATAVMGALLVWSFTTSIARLRDPDLTENSSDMSEPTEGAERLFLARSTFAIAGLSIIAMVAVASPAFFFETCY